MLHHRHRPSDTPPQCPFGICDGSGFKIDEQANTAYDCTCRSQRVANARARRLRDDEELLLERRERELRPRDPDRLLDAWAQDYRFTHHDILTGHISGSGIELAHDLAQRLGALDVRHAFTGLPAAWTIDHFARFRLTTVYVEGDPRDAAKRLELRQASAGANVQLIGPDDLGLFIGEHLHDGLNCVSPVQVYLDLLHLPERAHEAAEHLRRYYLHYASAG